MFQVPELKQTRVVRELLLPSCTVLASEAGRCAQAVDKQRQAESRAVAERKGFRLVPVTLSGSDLRKFITCDFDAPHEIRWTNTHQLFTIFKLLQYTRATRLLVITRG